MRPGQTLGLVTAAFLLGGAGGLALDVHPSATASSHAPWVDRAYEFPAELAGPTIRLLPMPDLECVGSAQAQLVQPIWVAGAWEEALAHENLSRVLLFTLGEEIEVRPFLHAPTLADAWAYGLELTNGAVAAVTHDYYSRDPVAYGREYYGYACGRAAVISVGPFTGCPLTVFAHEVGHNFGRRHQPEGVMRSPVQCDLEETLQRRPDVDPRWDG